MKQFFYKSTILTIIVFIIGAIVYTTIFKQFYLSVLPFMVLFFYVLTNLVHAYLIKIAGKLSAKFTAQYMATNFIKMFLYLAGAIVYVIFNKDNAKPFFVNFLLLYFVYTGFEVYEYLKIVKQNTK